MAEKLPEVWLRGALPNIPPLLQPIAHSLLQAREEVVELMKDFPDQLLWIRPANAASVGFHLQHLSGVLDRLFTYANGNSLTEQQLTALKAEGNPHITKAGSAELVGQFNSQVDKALDALKQFDQKTLTDSRAVGRAQLPSTVQGLLFHAAEHTMRHLGQLLVSVKVVKQMGQL
ncbi:MAG: DinB family protein [Flavisolibacter sp.]